MFWIYVAVLIVIALIIVIIPLWKVEDTSELSREDQNIAIAKQKLEALKAKLENNELTDEQYEVAKSDLENALALDLENSKDNTLHHGGKWLIIFVAIALPLASLGLYQKIGKPDLLDPKAKLAELQKEQIDLQNMSVEDMIKLVKKRLTENPEDGEGWYVLGRTFMTIQKYQEAVTAYKRSYELVGEDPNIILSLADAIAMTNEGLMKGEPEALVNKALEIDPNNEIGLWLGGLSAEQRNDIPLAYKHWSNLLPLLEGNPASYNEIKEVLVQLKSTFPELPDLPFNEQNQQQLVVNLTISMDENIKNKLKGNEEVFVYAKAVTGPPMPLAAKKLKVSDLPIAVSLSDADAMMPQLKLSSAEAFTVGARISMSGNPIAQKGDYFIEVSNLTNEDTKKPIDLLINRSVE